MFLYVAPAGTEKEEYAHDDEGEENDLQRSDR